MAEKTVEKIMHKRVIISGSETTVMKAANEMVEKNIGSLVVIEDNKPVGIVTESDIVKKVVASGVSSKLITLGDIMSKKLVTITKDESIFEASRIMHEKGIKKLPIIDRDKVVGIITSTDIVDELSELNMK